MIRFVLMLVALLAAQAAYAIERVSTHLVLALDCSESVTISRWRAQLHGYSSAFRNPEIIAALSRGVGVTVVIWSGPDEQWQVVPWTRIHDETSAHLFATLVDRIPKKYAGYTNIGSAISFSTQLLMATDPNGVTRRIIDISGDGQHRESAHPNTPRGIPLETARAQAHARDITIHGLPIEGDEFEISDYYRNSVIVGEGSFIETVSDPDDTGAFGKAILRKLLRELLASAR